MLLALPLVLIFAAQASELRAFDQEQMQQYAEQADFEYMNYAVTPPSIWERIGWWLQSLLEQFFMDPNTPWLTQIAYYLLLVLILGLAIFYVVRLRYGGGVATDYKNMQFATTGLETTKAEDFEQLIKAALEERNYKLAIRYVYLQSLAGLAKRELIKLKDWKSPYDYERELKSELAGSYREIARLFEYVWYGDFEVGIEDFERGKALSSKLESIR